MDYLTKLSLVARALSSGLTQYNPHPRRWALSRHLINEIDRDCWKEGKPDSYYITALIACGHAFMTEAIQSEDLPKLDA